MPGEKNYCRVIPEILITDYTDTVTRSVDAEFVQAAVKQTRTGERLRAITTEIHQLHLDVIHIAARQGSAGPWLTPEIHHLPNQTDVHFRAGTMDKAATSSSDEYLDRSRDSSSERGGTLKAGQMRYDDTSILSRSADKASTMDKVKKFFTIGKKKRNSRYRDDSMMSDDVDAYLSRVASEGNLAVSMDSIMDQFKRSFTKKKKDKREKKSASHHNDTGRISGFSSLEAARESLSAAGHGYSRPQGRPAINDFTDAFVRYGPKSSLRPYGMGALVILPFFTEDLTGYKVDVRAAKEFFHQELGYQLFEAEPNLTRQGLFDYLEQLQHQIQTSKQEFDRLVCIILTHGLKDGLLTCADRGGMDEEKKVIRDVDGKFKEVNVYTQVEEILEYFKHDENNLPKLKGCPKLVMIQACQGTTVVRAASKPGSAKSSQDSLDSVVDLGPEVNLQFRPNIPLDADMEVCYATTTDNYSFVHPNHGSWLIQDMLTIFRKHMYDHHVAEMLTVLRLSVSEKRMRFEIEEGTFTTAIQIPTVTSTFRKQFWLHHGLVASHSSVALRAASLQPPKSSESYPTVLSEVNSAKGRSELVPHSAAAPKFQGSAYSQCMGMVLDDSAAAERRRNKSGDILGSSCPDVSKYRRGSLPMIFYPGNQPIVIIQNNGSPEVHGAAPSIPQRKISPRQATQTSVKNNEVEPQNGEDGRDTTMIQHAWTNLEDPLDGDSTPIVWNSDPCPLATLEEEQNV